MADTIAKKSTIEKDWKTEEDETDPPLREAPKVLLLRIHGLRPKTSFLPLVLSVDVVRHKL